MYYCSSSEAVSGKTAILFAGQGSQYVGMGANLVSSFSTIRQSIEQFDTFRSTDPVSRYMYPAPCFDSKAKKEQQQELTQTENAQAAIGALSMGMFGS